MPKPTTLAAAAALALAPGLALATATYGSLANFDVVNDTGHTAHGFEIELEGITRSDILDVFGLNRDFGLPGGPGAVERYGMPTIEDMLGAGGGVIGQRVTYRASFAGGAWSAGTSSGTFANPGDSCWALGGVNYPNISCDHFGVSTRGTPTRTTYNWLVESPGDPSTLLKNGLAVPAVVFTPPAPVAPGAPPAPVQAAVQAQQVVAGDPRANAFWVKIVQTTLPDNADLNDLLAGQHAGARPEIIDLNHKTETEIEWQVLQFVDGRPVVDEVTKALNLNGDPSVVVRFEFFKYQGRFDGEGLVDPSGADTPHGNVLTAAVGDYVGRQLAAYNAVAAAPVPEPQAWAMLAAGLALLAWPRRPGRRARAG